jgi:hypothetical protein
MAGGGGIWRGRRRTTCMAAATTPYPAPQTAWAATTDVHERLLAARGVQHTEAGAAGEAAPVRVELQRHGLRGLRSEVQSSTYSPQKQCLTFYFARIQRKQKSEEDSDDEDEVVESSDGGTPSVDFLSRSTSGLGRLREERSS